MDMLRYISLWLQASLLRLMMRYKRGPILSSPDQVIYILSRDKHRKIKVHVYKPKLAEIPGPVVINFHGSGWLLPLHGQDDKYCRKVAQEVGCTVLDVQYRLSPENPFPAANNDAEDVVNWARAQEDFSDRMSISGFSAGANIALVACGVTFPRGTFDSVIAFYPSTNFTVEPADKAAPDPSGVPLAVWMSNLFRACFIPPETNHADPRISPLFAPLDRFPNKALIVTAACDTLCHEGEALAGKLKESGRTVVLYRAAKCNHGWDKQPPAAKAGTPQNAAMVKTYAMAVEMLLH